MDFSSPQFVLTEMDLKKLLSNCSKCMKSTANANLIMHHESLSKLDLNELRGRKLAIIINSEEKTLGHWITLLVARSPSNFAIYMDSENKLKHENPNIFSNIKKFCNRNNLKLVDRSFKSQKLGNYNCGFHALHTIAKFIHLSQSEFSHYFDALRSNPFHTNENRIVRFVLRHFK